MTGEKQKIERRKKKKKRIKIKRNSAYLIKRKSTSAEEMKSEGKARKSEAERWRQQKSKKRRRRKKIKQHQSVASANQAACMQTSAARENKAPLAARAKRATPLRGGENRVAATCLYWRVWRKHHENVLRGYGKNILAACARHLRACHNIGGGARYRAGLAGALLYRTIAARWRA